MFVKCKIYSYHFRSFIIRYFLSYSTCFMLQTEKYSQAYKAACSPGVHRNLKYKSNIMRFLDKWKKANMITTCQT